MSTTSPQSDLHQALQSWHAALTRNDLEAQIAARLLLDILVAGGLDERIEEITQPAGFDRSPILPLLRQANCMTRELGHLAACQLATARALDRSLTSRSAAATPSPIRPAPEARRQGMARLDLARLLVLLAMAAYAGFLIGVAHRPPPPWWTYGIPGPQPAPPAPAKPPAGSSITAALAPRMPHAS